MTYGRLAQLVEHLLDVQEVTGSSPVPSTTSPQTFWSGDFFRGGRCTGLEQHGHAAGGATNTPVGCLLVRGSQCVGMSTKKDAARPFGLRIFFVVAVQDENRDKQRQSITMTVVSCLLLCIPLYCAFRVNRCVCPSVRTREKGRVLTYSSGLLSSCMVYSNQ